MLYLKTYENSKKYFLLILILVFVQNNIQAQEKVENPNIVWIVTEDNAWHYSKLYNEAGASMPTIERLAKSGIVFNHAFSNAPVCSVARSTIISGCYAPRVGAQYHRRMQFAPMPEGLEMFPYYLRKAGYYTTNNSKEDYNFIKGEEVWDESSNKATFKNRKEGQPFFHVQNFGITHEGQLHFSKAQMEKEATAHKQSEVNIFDYHPQTSLFKYTHAKYLDLHQKADKAIGDFLDELEAQGLMENTIIFYYGDHGGVLPRSKGYIYESGLHVPMVVYVPEKWKHLAAYKQGSRSDAFIQFIDLAPTVLNLAGAKIPEQMDGSPFLGKDISKAELENRQTAFSYADRFDEKYDLVRGFRKGKYKYLRSYQPFNRDALYNFYRYKMLAYQEWKALFEEGKLNGVQKQFFMPRASEALYDLEEDPHETNNLASNQAYQPILKELRAELRKQVKSMPDLSFYPEPYFLENGLENPVAYGQANKKQIGKLIRIADLSLLSFKKAEKKIAKALASQNPWERYWALIVCSTFGEEANQFQDKIEDLAKNDSENLVKVRAAEYLGLHTNTSVDDILLASLKTARSESESNLILNTVALLTQMNKDFSIEIPEDLFKKAWLNGKGTIVDKRLDYINE